MFYFKNNTCSKILHFHCRGKGLISGGGTKILHVTQQGQNKNKKS